MDNAFISASYTWSQFIPAFVLVGIACLILMADSFLPKFPKRAYALVAAIGALVTGCFISRDGAMGSFAFLACVATGLSMLLAFDYTKVTADSIAGGDNEEGTSEFYALPLIACAGILALTQARDLIMLFVSLEVITLSSYVLAGYFRRNQGSIEAGVKYLILGAMSTGLLVFGAAWFFGITGTFMLEPFAIDNALRGVLIGSSPNAVLICFSLTMAFLLMGAFFKVGAAPMHIWIPDVYQGAPTPTSTFLAVASKTAGFVVLCALLIPFNAFAAPNHPHHEVVQLLVMVLAVVTAVTLLIGNLGAINQKNAKRLLGYSSIGQAGFILAFFLNMGDAVLQLANVYSYLLAYTLATVSAFAAIAMVRTQRGSEEISAFRGLGKTNPRTAFLITVSFASLAGVPLTMGFLVKFQAFLALLSAMGSWTGITWLLPIMIVCAAVGFYYYFKVLRAMYWEKPQEGDKPLCVPGVTAGLLTVCAIALIVLGSLPLIGYIG